MAASQRLLGLALVLAIFHHGGCKSEPDNQPAPPATRARTGPQLPSSSNGVLSAMKQPSRSGLASDTIYGLKPKPSPDRNSDCTPSGCGGNSPVVNRFPVNGLNPAGYKNAQGFRLVPQSVKSLNPGSPCNGQTLTADDKGHLTTTDPRHACGSYALLGSSFTIEGPRGKKNIIIRSSDLVPTSTIGKYIQGYIFTTPDNTTSLCDTTASFNFQNDLLQDPLKDTPIWKELKYRDSKAMLRLSISNLSNLAAIADPAPIRDTRKANQEDLAIVFPGEVRGEDTQTLLGSMGQGWFNIACARDALAKLDLDNLAPHEQNPTANSDYDPKRTAALKMVTAYYCSRANQPGNSARYTYEGNAIEWESKSLDEKWEYHGKPSNPNIEAFWSSTGAVCLEHTRLYYKNPPSGIPLDALPQWCLDPDHDCSTEPPVLKALSEQDCPGINIQMKCDRNAYEKQRDVFFISHSH
jgi:hypothetical protein